MDTSKDLLQKRAFFQKVHELKQIVCELITIFGSAFYGSPLWNLKSEEYLELLKSWNTMVKILFDLPFQTHTRFIESLSKVTHLQSTLHGRFIGFVNNLKNSVKPEINMLINLCENDISSNTCLLYTSPSPRDS